MNDEIDEKELEALVQLARTPKPKKTFVQVNKELMQKNLPEIERFFIQLEIKKGTHKTTLSAMYEAYGIWSPSPMNLDSFKREIDKHFREYKNQNDAVMYRLNKSGGSLVIEARRYHENEEKDKTL